MNAPEIPTQTELPVRAEHVYVRDIGRCTCGLLADDCAPLVVDLCGRVLAALAHAPDWAFPVDFANLAGTE